MIGNTDFSVPANHNIKLILPKADTMQAPYIVPYDFDYAGFVNAPYAIPDPMLGIEQVTERLYRGFARTLEELEEVLVLFRAKKPEIYALIDNFPPFEVYTKKDAKQFLNDFFEVIDSEKSIKAVFINSARRD
jgi:hypothetical protein